MLSGVSLGLTIIAVYTISCSGAQLAPKENFCHDAVRKCKADDSCRPKFELVNIMCKNDRNCDAQGKARIVCTQLLPKITEDEPVLNCFCPTTIEPAEDLQRCKEVFQLLFQHPCINQQKQKQQQQQQQLPQAAQKPVATEASHQQQQTTTTTRSPTTAMNLLDAFGSHNQPPDDGRGGSCVDEEQLCRDNPDCWHRALNFQRHCQHVSKQQCLPARSRCLEAYESLRNRRLIPCTCRGHSGQRAADCHRIRRVFPGNMCLSFFNDAHNSGLSPNVLLNGKVIGRAEDSDADSGSAQLQTKVANAGAGSNAVQQQQKQQQQQQQQQLSHVQAAVKPIEVMNCFDVYTGCTKHFRCRRTLVSLQQACAWHSATGSCNRKLCKSMLHALYGAADFYAENAATCECPDSDFGCQQMRQLFRPRCAHQPATPRSCTSLIQSCIGMSSCQSKYILYLQKCNSSTCHGRQGSCLRFRRLLFGTDLTYSCTCDEVMDPMLNTGGLKAACNKIKQLLDKPSCLSLPRITSQSPATDTNACQQASRHSMTSGQMLRLRLNQTCTILCSCNSGEQRCVPPVCDTQLGQPHLSCSSSRAQQQQQQLESGCTCFGNGQLVCPPSLPSHAVSGHYLSLGTSSSEVAALQALGVQPPSNWSRLVAELLWRSDAVDTCTLQQVRSTAFGAVLRLDAARSQSIRFCLSHLRLLVAMVTGRHTALTVSPQMSLARAALLSHVGAVSGRRGSAPHSGDEAATRRRLQPSGASTAGGEGGAWRLLLLLLLLLLQAAAG